MTACSYVGYALTTQWEGVEAKSQQVIGFDMGGTSTDVSRFAGTYEHVFESVTAGAIAIYSFGFALTGAAVECNVFAACRCDNPSAAA